MILVLFPHQLNDAYTNIIKNNLLDQVYILDTDEQYKRFNYHKKRILLHKSCIYHFIEEKKSNYPNIKALTKSTIHEALCEFNRISIYTPTDKADKKALENLDNIDYLTDPLFLISEEEWKTGVLSKPWKMDKLYRYLRQKKNILMNNNKPIGGKYSYDSENRKPYSKNIKFIDAYSCKMDDLSLRIANKIETDFPNNPGSTKDFDYPINRFNALKCLDHFIENRLETFGEHQDVMIINNPKMSHSMLSSSINMGLLSPEEVIYKAEKVYYEKNIRLSSVEGFIRQILGWREYIRGMYLLIDDYENKNIFNHSKDLPAFFWTGKTKLNCLSETISETIKNSYNHHIQRLMILSNFANLVNVEPLQLRNWFNEMYIDSFDWVVTPNVLGMGLYSDGGIMSTKPYISSGSYINKMSNYCDNCFYDPKIKIGPRACPFNNLYWNFINDKKENLKNNPRMRMMNATFNKFDDKIKRNHIDSSNEFIKNLK